MKIIGGFIVNLLQDVNILRPLVYLTADNIGIKPLIFVTQSFVKRDKFQIWMNELQSLSNETQADLYLITSLIGVWQKLDSYTNGFLISASESDLNSHKETHEIFKVAPSTISTVTLQHGFECVGFLMNKHHQHHHGSSVGFASDYICGWVPKELQRNLRPLQYSRYHNLGPTAWLQQTSKRIFNSNIDYNDPQKIGIVCENLHSVRFAGKSNVNLFMQQFLELAEHLEVKGSKIALRPHPGGQYSINSNMSLPKNVVLVNQPSYKVNWKDYSFGISAPSSVLFDLMVNNVPVMVWQDQQQIIDITQHAFLPVAHSAKDMISFADYPLGIASSSTNQQLGAIFRDGEEIANNYTHFLEMLCGKSSSPKFVSVDPSTLSISKKIRVLLMAPAVTPTLTISFVKPLSLIPHLIEYQLIHETGSEVLEGESGKEANARRCEKIIDTYQPDVLVMCRYGNKDAVQLSELCNQQNIKVVYYIDDLLFDPSPTTLEKKKYLNYKARAQVILDLIDKSDLIYCSTPDLSKQLAVTTQHQNIQFGKICLSVDPQSIAFHNSRRKVIGYTGFGHTQDLESIEDVLLEVLREYPDWCLELIGTMTPSAKLLSLGQRLTLIPPERDYAAFISLLKSRNWSIGICPLIENRFNSSKANNKWIEYSCCNIATIASDLDPYRYGSPESCLFICNSTKMWKKSFVKLINSQALIDELILNSQDLIRNNYSDKALSIQVFDLIQGLIRESI